MDDLEGTLRHHGIKPTPQRLAVAGFVLRAVTHPSADEVLSQVRRTHPTVSRATVDNTLNLLVDRELLRARVLKEGTVVFDPNLARHHHFIDEETGCVYDVPWEALEVKGADFLDGLEIRGQESLEGLEVREYYVVMRGRTSRSKHGN
jgi:Fur family transcriptional regulator, iron response regulator